MRSNFASSQKPRRGKTATATKAKAPAATKQPVKAPAKVAESSKNSLSDFAYQKLREAKQAKIRAMNADAECEKISSFVELDDLGRYAASENEKYLRLLFEAAKDASFSKARVSLPEDVVLTLRRDIYNHFISLNKLTSEHNFSKQLSSYLSNRDIKLNKKVAELTIQINKITKTIDELFVGHIMAFV